ncbi:MAG: sensor histidine kinase [Pirellulales bacterium]|nr:sensor histidine kinase [Pirellulales bacterium]
MAHESCDFQEQIAILKEQLREAQKMTALGELVSTTTHEFNNVLMTIMNYAKIGMRHQDTATRDKSFDQILTAARRAEKITNSVLGLARNRSRDFVPTDLGTILDETLVLLEREMNKYHIVIELRLDTVPKVLANGNQIQQVLLNLLINARQAMPKGGRLWIHLAHDPEMGMVDLTIRDTGHGIPKDQLPRIFERFYTTKTGPDSTGKGGTGVGLAMCRDIIEAHQGKIRVQSEPGMGTAFTIRLPVACPRKSNTAPAIALGIPKEFGVPN